MYKTVVYGFLAAALFIPSFVVHADGVFGPIGQLLVASDTIITYLIGTASSIALLVFIWGIVKYIASAGDEKAKVSAKSTMVYGVIALAVLFSVFGLVEFLQDNFDIHQDGPVAPPQIDFTP